MASASSRAHIPSLEDNVSNWKTRWRRVCTDPCPHLKAVLVVSNKDKCYPRRCRTARDQSHSSYGSKMPSPQENEGLYGGPTARSETAACLTVSPHGNPARGHRWQWITKRCEQQKAKETGADHSSFPGSHRDLLTAVRSDPQVQFTPSTQQLNIFSAPPAWVLTGRATLKCSPFWGQSRRPPPPHWPTFPPLCPSIPILLSRSRSAEPQPPRSKPSHFLSSRRDIAASAGESFPP